MQWTRNSTTHSWARTCSCECENCVALILVILIRLLFLFVGTHTHTHWRTPIFGLSASQVRRVDAGMHRMKLIKSFIISSILFISKQLAWSVVPYSVDVRLCVESMLLNSPQHLHRSIQSSLFKNEKFDFVDIWEFVQDVYVARKCATPVSLEMADTVEEKTRVKERVETETCALQEQMKLISFLCEFSGDKRPKCLLLSAGACQSDVICTHCLLREIKRHTHTHRTRWRGAAPEIIRLHWCMRETQSARST